VIADLRSESPLDYLEQVHLGGLIKNRGFGDLPVHERIDGSIYILDERNDFDCWLSASQTGNEIGSSGQETIYKHHVD